MARKASQAGVEPVAAGPEAGVEPAAAEAEELPALYTSRIRLCNPFQNEYLHDIPRKLTIDSWWEAQIEAGLVTKVQ